MGFGRSLESVDHQRRPLLGPDERPSRLFVGVGVFFWGDAPAEEESRLRARAAKMARPHANEPRTMGPGVEFQLRAFLGATKTQHAAAGCRTLRGKGLTCRTRIPVGKFEKGQRGLIRARSFIAMWRLHNIKKIRVFLIGAKN